MKHRIFTLLVVAAITITALSSGLQLAAAQSPTGTVNTGALNIRTGPGISYPAVTFVYRNTTLTLLARNADSTWVKVAAPSNVQGWVNVKYIWTSYPIAYLPLDYGTGGQYTGTVTSYGLNVRTGPGASYSRITAISRGTRVYLLARDAYATWLKIQLTDGRQGWVHSGYISTTTPIWNLPVEGGTQPPTPVPPTPVPGYRTHTVQPGENLFRISLRYGVNMYDVARLNGITNLTLIYVGQVLLIP